MDKELKDNKLYMGNMQKRCVVCTQTFTPHCVVLVWNAQWLTLFLGGLQGLSGAIWSSASNGWCLSPCQSVRWAAQLSGLSKESQLMTCTISRPMWHTWNGWLVSLCFVVLKYAAPQFANYPSIPNHNMLKWVLSKFSGELEELICLMSNTNHKINI